MRGLHQDRARASEQHGDLAVHLPADALRPEVAENRRPWSCAPLYRPSPGTKRSAASGLPTVACARIRSPNRVILMTIVVLVLALAVLAGIIAGGSVRFLERIRVHWWGLAPVALVLQSIPLPVGSAERAGLAAASLVASYVLLARGGGGEPTGARCGTHGDGTDDEPGRRRVERRDAGEPRRDVWRRERTGRSSSRTGPSIILMSEADRAAAAGGRDPGCDRRSAWCSRIGDVLLYGGMAWWCFTVTRGRFRENLRPPARRSLMYRGKHAPESYRLPARYRRAPETALVGAARSGIGP